MYKVVVVDDEPIIVEGLSRMIRWDEYECEIVKSSNDGIDGMKVIREIKPDIIFTDIAMPGMDGLTMLAGLKSEFGDTEICILTGYRDFDYAKKAIELGVTRFLLKPSILEEIEEAIQCMCANLKAKNILPNDTKHKSEDIDSKSESIASSFIVSNAIKYIEENYKHKITLAEVAEKTYVSQWHLSKLLNRKMDMNFSEILNHIRIREAQKLLSEPGLRIGDIAEKVGFIDIAHFSRVFKKVVGVSANEYRNLLANHTLHTVEGLLKEASSQLEATNTQRT